MYVSESVTMISARDASASEKASKTIKKPKIPKLRTVNIAYWVFCDLITTET